MLEKQVSPIQPPNFNPGVAVAKLPRGAGEKMYESFFGLREKPFNVNPDPRYLFFTPHFRNALDTLTYGIDTRKGLILLTGEVGTGKTTLVNHLLDLLHENRTPAAFIFNSRLKARDLFEFLLADFEVTSNSGSDGNVVMRLNRWFLELYRTGKTAVLIVDEAQGLSLELLEEIRLLFNFETPNEKLLQVILVGQPELEEKLKQYELRQLRQRITLRCKTMPLEADETRAYVEARLKIAGSDGHEIFTSEAINAIYKYSYGIPRVINLLCEHCLINAYVDDLQLVTPDIVEGAARELQLADGNRAPSGPFVVAKPGGSVIDSGISTIASDGAPDNWQNLDTIRSLTARLETVASSREASQPERELPAANELTSGRAFQLLCELAPKLRAITSASNSAAMVSETSRSEVLSRPLSFPLESSSDVNPDDEVPVSRPTTGDCYPTLAKAPVAKSPVAKPPAAKQIPDVQRQLLSWAVWSKLRWYSLAATSRIEQIPAVLSPQFGRMARWLEAGRAWRAQRVFPNSAQAAMKSLRQTSAFLIHWLQQPIGQVPGRPPQSSTVDSRSKCGNA